MIRACDIFKSYGNSDNPLPVLRDFIGNRGGEFAVILGASGSGKSTLLNVLSGLRRRIREKCFPREKDQDAERELTQFRRNMWDLFSSSIICCLI